MKKIRVLICDDSALMRRSLKKIIESDPILEAAGTARDGEDAVNKARLLKPDVITMDVNMPGLDGISALQIITHEKIAPVVMVSSLTQEGAEVTFEALALGAFDVVPKPGGTVSINMAPVQNEIIRKIKAAANPGVIEKLTSKKSGAVPKKRTSIAAENKPDSGSVIDFKAVAIGISTGGPKIIFEVLPYLPQELPAAVFLVQHMPGKFTKAFAARINANCAMQCIEAAPGLEVKPGVIYLAKGGSHMTLHKKPDGKIVIRCPAKPDDGFIPSVNVMMESVLKVFGSNTIGVLMTGMGDDGADAMVNIRNSGGITIAESEESAIVFGMPKEAIDRGGADKVLPFWKIADEIINAVGVKTILRKKQADKIRPSKGNQSEKTKNPDM